MGSPKISVIVTVDKAQGLERFLDSVLHQSLSEIEVICVLQGAADEILPIVRSFAEGDSRIRTVFANGASVGEAVNQGLQEASGEYLYLCDPSCLCDLYLFEHAVAKAESTNADIVVFDYEKVKANGKAEKVTGVRSDWLPRGAETFNRHDCPERILSVMDDSTCNKLYRASFVCDNDLRCEETCFGEIVFSALAAAFAGTIAILRECLCSRPEECSRISTQEGSDRLKDFEKTVSSAIEQALASTLHDEIDDAITFFALDKYIFGLFNYVTDCSTPEAEAYYKGVRTFFLSERFNGVDRETVGDDRLFNRYFGVCRHDYESYRDMRSRRLIVSFTTYPARIGLIHTMLETIYAQTRPADEVVLYLTNEEFPGGKSEVPGELLKLAKEGKLTLKWRENLRPHTKYFYAFQDYPDDIVVTVDDDKLYQPSLLEDLYDSYLMYPEAVSAGRVHLMTTTENGEILPYGDWVREANFCRYEPSMQLFATGVGGVLYPPHVLDEDLLLNKQVIKETCLNADDLWLKAVELLSDVSVVLSRKYTVLGTVSGSQETALMYSNLDGNLNDVQWGNIKEWAESQFGEGIIERKLLQPAGTQLLGTEVALRCSEEKAAELRALAKAKSDREISRLKSQVKNLQAAKDASDKVSQRLAARIDVKNFGSQGNSVTMLDVSDNATAVSYPAWFSDEKGKGLVIDSTAARLDFRFICAGDGELQIKLRARDVKDGEGASMPILIDYSTFKVNGTSVFSGTKCVWSKSPYVFKRKVHDGEIVVVSLSWHSHDMRGLASELGARDAIEKQSRDVQSEAERLSNMLTARIDLKNAGAEDNDLEILKISDLNAREEMPAWFRDNTGVGHVVKANSGRLDLYLLCVGKGRLRIRLRGQDVKNSDGVRIPLWIDYTSLVVDGEPMLKGTWAAWHDRPIEISRQVEDGQVVSLSLTWHSHDECGLGAAPKKYEEVKDSKEYKDLAGKNAELEAKVKKQANEIDRLHASRSWKIGRAITWLPRKIKKWARSR